ncbi:MAG: ABC transporter permease, partial [Candidatus Thermoplasmatota archaeon]|nr:ABC transporter permease [Candidatus Thermoplasmatota archaeon]
MTEKNRDQDFLQTSDQDISISSIVTPNPSVKPLPDRIILNSVWSGLDRKAGAIIEFTARQLRVRASTWVIGTVGLMLMLLLLATYAEAMVEGIEPVDDDGDSEDWDEDGYPLGQERKWGTSDWNSAEFPGSGVFVSDEWLNWNQASHTGNHTYRGNAVITSYTWIGSPPNSQNKGWAQVGNFSDCTEYEEEYDLQIGRSCLTSSGDIRFNGLIQVNGTVGVESEKWYQYLEWGEFVGASDTPIPQDPRSMYIDEDGFDIDVSSGETSQGFDDDGDCIRDWDVISTTTSNPEFIWVDYFMSDSNRNGIDCDVELVFDTEGNLISIEADNMVDEDPSEDEFVLESLHRGFVLAVGKVAFLFLLGIFIPLFLATGLIRDEMASGTMYYLIGKPIHRAEFFIYRILGFMSISAPYMVVLALLVGLVTSFIGPGDSLFRFQDLTVWLIIGITAALVLLAYSTTFSALGVISKRFGIYIAMVMGV